MKRVVILLMMTGVFTLGHLQSMAQTEEDSMIESQGDSTELVDGDSSTVEEAPIQEEVVEEVAVVEEDYVEEKPGFHQIVKEQFIAGGWEFMGIVLLCLILGLAVAIERIITLNLATTNTKKLLSQVEDALAAGGVEAAKDVCRNTQGPVASIFVQGLMRMSEGIEMVEKSIIAYGSVEMGKLEKGMTWISLFISLAPMLGFMGTVIGMIGAFDAIAEAGDVSPALVAGGIKVALLTTVGGLIVAVILQLFYNYLVSKIDSLVNSMEDASISLIDILVKHSASK
ncbi:MULTISPECIES: MotA/TolQ/ExbB proton channel family protein [Reichenbachiella]|uniref:Biopolymer transport protein ExbB n=1 Tax=Reichenbachiella agariperforans TaxID=156994 RepID=A0A1M6LCS7_REIAG|nr:MULTISPECIES: MotA/TolQ/ExbB proton channel family protein [Reichenbachiella]MBU2913876.1 MotA/TolQ/ExbB proton channel family protein [Reichenbachiella agariperforans]RJE74208.1 flagellar motor protein MotA [Reichenbachiella sp. MSK19-1]SHJ68966.1 biopolymer transport protein ExbB [Reichenbachiella agariperforans]